MKVENYSGSDGILVKEELAYQIPVTVNADIPVDSDGNKYLLAGTWLTAPQDVTLTTDAVVMTPTNDPSKAQGILTHDTNLIDGPKAGSLILWGIINRNMSDPSIMSQYYTDDQVHNLKKSLPNITIIGR